MIESLLAVTFVALGVLPPQEPSAAAASSRDVELPRGLFVENRGQWGGDSGYRLLGTSMSVAMERGRIRFRAGTGPADPAFSLHFADVEPQGDGQETRVNWLVGKTQEAWQRGLEAHRTVRYPDLAEGIDLVVRVADEGLRYDLELDAKSDPGLVAIQVEGVDELRLDSDGELVMRTPNGELRQTPPLAWQETEDGIREVACAFRLLGGNRYGFALEGHDPLLPTTIDPTLAVSYESYFIDVVMAIVPEPVTGDVFLGGFAENPFPFPDPMPTVHPIGDPTVGSGNYVGFLARLSPTDSPSVRYLTLIGGSAEDWVQDLALDSGTGRIWAYGATASADFPVTTGPGFDGGWPPDAFLLGLDATQGDVLFVSTLLGIEFRDWGRLVLDGGRALVSGTLSNPPLGLFQTFGTPADNDAFVLSVDLLTGDRLDGFVVGGPANQDGSSVAVDPGNAIYLVGSTQDPGSFLETVGSFGVPVPPSTKKRGQTVPPPGDAFVVRFKDDLSAVEYSTRIGGEDWDWFRDVAIYGNLVVAVGETRSTSLTPFPVGGDGTNAGGGDAFVSVLDFSGFTPGMTPVVPLMTYLGGAGSDGAWAVDTDGTGRIHVAGITQPGSGGRGRGGGGSEPFPEIDNGTGLFKQGPEGEDGFYSVFDLGLLPDALVYSTLIGGSGTNEEALHLSVSPDGTAHVVMLLKSETNLPVTNNAAYPLRLSGLDSWIGVIGPVLH